MAAAGAVEVVTAERGTVEKGIDSSGKVESNLDVDIKCRASGEVVKLPFDISESVKKGEFVVVSWIRTDEQLAVRSAAAVAVTQATAQVAQAKYDLEQAQQNLETTRRKDESALASAGRR